MVVVCHRNNRDKSHDDCHSDGLYDLSCDQGVNNTLPLINILYSYLKQRNFDIKAVIGQ